MYVDESNIIAKSSNMLHIFKPLYILHTVLGMSSVKIDGKKFTGVGKLQKIFCVLACARMTLGDANMYRNRFKNQFGEDLLKNNLDFLCYLSYLMCVLISWIMAAFVNGESTMKMILNFCEVDVNLKVFKNLKPSQPLYLKLLFFHVLTLCLILLYVIIGAVFLYRTFARVWTFIFVLIGNLMMQKFATEMYMIIVYVNTITIQIEEFRVEESMETVNTIKANEVCLELHTMMNLYIKLYENSCIANNIASLPVILRNALFIGTLILIFSFMECKILFNNHNYFTGNDAYLNCILPIYIVHEFTDKSNSLAYYHVRCK